MLLHEAIKKRLYQLCKEQGLSFRRLCKNSGVIQTTIFTGRQKIVRVTILKELCDGLNINLKQFFNSEYFEQIEEN